MTPERVEAIVRVIQRLTGEVSWEAVQAGVEAKLKLRYRRQTLHSHPAILLAFQARKDGAAALAGERPVSARAQAEADWRADMLAKLAASERRNQALIETNLRYLFNATSRGVTLEQLEQPLPTINRA